MKNIPLLNHYQAWLNDFTRINLFHGLCQQEIEHWHKLAITSCRSSGGMTSAIVVPQCLLQVTQTSQEEECTVIPRLNKRTDYSLLPGVLLSECYRLGKSRLAEQLQMLFRLHTQPGFRQTLTLLCWCELVAGRDLDEWYSLHLPLPDTLKQWMSEKQKSYRGLKTLTENYIRATRPM